MIQAMRIQTLKKRDKKGGDYVLYWMQASQRAECNHTLEYSAQMANDLRKPLVVFFGITDAYPEANERHYAFMLEGLIETQSALEKRGIRMVVRYVSPEKGIGELAERACLVVVDRGYTRIQRKWRTQTAARLECPFIQVEGDVIVPVEETSVKEEYSAATLRSKIRKKIDEYLILPIKCQVKCDSLGLRFENFDIGNVETALSSLNINRSVKRCPGRKGGTSTAKGLLDRFIERRLAHYAEHKNDPTLEGTSELSPYLHFGQISPLYIAKRIMKRSGPGTESFLEELIVRRELSVNFVYYNHTYDRIQSLPDWCRTTLKEHERDQREYLYSLEEFEQAATHDPYWNAAQKEMMHTGRMHGYMRMYWGKKIIEWTEKPDEAFRIALFLNNKYELDGRDPSGYAGVAWCFGKHDRPWKERPVFGKIRFMNDRGLCRKFDADGYVKKIEKSLFPCTSRDPEASPSP